MLEFSSLDEVHTFIDSGRMRLVYLSRPECGVCNAIKPKLMEVLNQYPEIQSAYINMDKMPQSAGAFSIFTIPGIILYIDGREMIREARYISIEDIDLRIKRYYEMVFSD